MKNTERPHLNKDELRFHGFNACLALWNTRPKDVIRVYVLRELAEQFSELLSFCAKQRKAYHLVDEGDLERLTDTVHHQGICMVAKARRPIRGKDLFRELGSGRTLLLYLDGVSNPHNLGAILRTAAHFGVPYVAGLESELPRLSPSAIRTAEGAAEHVSLVLVEEAETFFDRLKSMGFQVYTFSAAAESTSLYSTRLGEKSVFVFGAEVEGVSGMIKSLQDMALQIPGTGVMESLNVSVAVGVAMSEFMRQGQERTVRMVKKSGDKPRENKA